MKNTRKSIIVLGTLHQVQGPKFWGYVDDPCYTTLLTKLIARGKRREEVDFIFEEASGQGPSIAEGLAKAGCYLDVDPARNQRAQYEIAEDVSIAQPPIDFEEDSYAGYREEKVDEHRKREELWLNRIQGEFARFHRGLMICGIAHALSFSFRLSKLNYDVSQFDYLPFHKICPREHL